MFDKSAAMCNALQTCAAMFTRPVHHDELFTTDSLGFHRRFK